MKYFIVSFIALTGLALCSGCASKNAVEPEATDVAPSQSVFAKPAETEPQHLLSAGRPEALQMQQLDVYQLTVPMGAISRSEEFWKRVDEQTVDIATYDLLLKNGIRVGIAPSSEWGYFKGIIDQYPATSRQCTATGGEMAAVELKMKEKINFQNVFYLNDQNQLYGRTFERCENAMGISFQPAPRKVSSVRVSVCPLVRSLRKRFEVSTRDDGEREIQYVCPENLYDLNLITDVPVDGFLVIAPSEHARVPSSLGSTFMVGGNIAERLEQVLLIVVRMVGTQIEPVAAAVQR